MTFTLGLVMIVKNESKVILRALESVAPYLDWWTIVDTGSEDDTKEKITKFFTDKNIKGELHSREWVNFGHNRSEAVSLAKDKADYLLLMDADFVFMIKDKNFKTKKLLSDCYMVKYEGGLDYRQVLFIKGNLKWRYIGKTHEYIMSEEKKTSDNIDYFTFFHHADGGCRPEKLTRDEKLLKETLEEEPKNERAMFYLANTLRDLGKYDEAIKWYQDRVNIGGWFEEVYYSLWQIARCKSMRGDSFWSYLGDLLRAHQYYGGRLEALYEAVEYCRIHEYYDLGCVLASLGIDKPYPKNNVLFIEKEIHEWKFLFETSILYFYNPNYKENGLKLTDKLLDEGKCPIHIRKRVELNRKYYVKEEKKDPEIEKILNSNVEKKKKKKKKKNKPIVEVKTNQPITEVKTNQPNVYISLSTIPTRIEIIDSCIKSLLNQKYKPTKIYLCLPLASRRENKKYDINHYKKTYPELEILISDKDYGPATKLLPLLKLDSIKDNDIIITVDDDIIYDDKVIEKLVSASINNPNDAICFCGWNVKRLIETVQYDFFYEEENDFGTTTFCDILEGYRGVAYRKKFFNNKIFDFKHDEIYTSDDIWISYCLALKGVKRRVVRYLPNRPLSKDEVWYDVWGQKGLYKDSNPIRLTDNLIGRNRNLCVKLQEETPNIWIK